MSDQSKFNDLVKEIFLSNGNLIEDHATDSNAFTLNNKTPIATCFYRSKEVNFATLLTLVHRYKPVQWTDAAGRPIVIVSCVVPKRLKDTVYASLRVKLLDAWNLIDEAILDNGLVQKLAAILPYQL